MDARTQSLILGVVAIVLGIVALLAISGVVGAIVEVVLIVGGLGVALRATGRELPGS